MKKEPLLGIHDPEGRAIETDSQGRVGIAVSPNASRMVVIKIGKKIQEAVLAGIDDSEEKEVQGTVRELADSPPPPSPRRAGCLCQNEFRYPLICERKANKLKVGSHE